MAQRTERRVYNLRLDQFERYLRDKKAELDAAIGEIEEVQQQFQQRFQEELETWQELFSFCFPRVAEQRSELPQDFQDYLDRIEGEEQERIRDEIADLEAKIKADREAMDKRMAEAQETLNGLRETNPELDAREEELKARIVELQDQYTQAYERMEELEKPALGWLTNLGALSRLRRTQRNAKREQNETIQKLRLVRQDWLDQVKATSDRQAELRQKWQEAGIESSELQARHDHLVTNFDELALEAGLQRALEEMTTAPAVEGELGDKLRSLAQHNVIRSRYESGLEVIAQGLGMLRGLSKGLDRFDESVRNVLAEQRRYNLRSVDIPVPGSVAALNQTWNTLGEKVRDEVHMRENPLEFVDIVKRYVTDRITEDVIQSYFEQLGDALNRGTAAWG